MIRRTIRLVVRLGLLTGIGLALVKLVKGRRAASEFGSPSADWAPPAAPNPNLPKTPPEPELVEPVMFEEIIEKKAAIRAVPDQVPAPGPVIAPDPLPAAEAPPVVTAEPAVADMGTPATKAPATKAPAKKAGPPAAAGAVKKVVPPRAVAKKVAPAPTTGAPVAKKAAPVKKAPKKSQ